MKNFDKYMKSLKSPSHEYCHDNFHVSHNGIAQLMYIMCHDQYAFVLQDGKWYKNMGTKWDAVPGLEYEIRNKISDEVYHIVVDSEWRPRSMDIDVCEALRELQFMLGTHEDKIAILKEMEARFCVLEVPVISKTPTAPTVTTKDPKKPQVFIEAKKLKSKSGWMGS